MRKVDPFAAIRPRWPIFALFLTLLLSACSAACPVTDPVLAIHPADSAVQGEPSPGYYFINGDRSIWASSPKGANGNAYPWRAGKDGVKVGWFRPAGAALEITGERLDGDAPPLEALASCCYPTRFQASGLVFPTEGCWKVTAKAEDKTLSFVVVVEPESGSVSVRSP